VDETLCIGCGACVEACPFGAMSLHPDTGLAMVCDLCGGEPKCVERCPLDVLLYEDPLSAARRRGLAAAEPVAHQIVGKWGIGVEEQ